MSQICLTTVVYSFLKSVCFPSVWLPITTRLNIHKSVNLRLFDRINTDPMQLVLIINIIIINLSNDTIKK